MSKTTEDKTIKCLQKDILLNDLYQINRFEHETVYMRPLLESHLTARPKTYMMEPFWMVLDEIRYLWFTLMNGQHRLAAIKEVLTALKEYDSDWFEDLNKDISYPCWVFETDDLQKSQDLPDEIVRETMNVGHAVALSDGMLVQLEKLKRLIRGAKELPSQPGALLKKLGMDVKKINFMKIVYAAFMNDQETFSEFYNLIDSNLVSFRNLGQRLSTNPNISSVILRGFIEIVFKWKSKKKTVAYKTWIPKISVNVDDHELISTMVDDYKQDSQSVLKYIQYSTQNKGAVIHINTFVLCDGKSMSSKSRKRKAIQLDDGSDLVKDEDSIDQIIEEIVDKMPAAIGSDKGKIVEKELVQNKSAVKIHDSQSLKEISDTVVETFFSIDQEIGKQILASLYFKLPKELKNEFNEEIKMKKVQ